MTDPFDFESRSKRASSPTPRVQRRPFDAAAIAAAAAAPSRGVGARSWSLPWTRRDGQTSALRVAFVVLLLAVVVTAGTVLVGALLRQAPLPDRLSLVPPVASPSPSPIHDPVPSAIPSATPPASASNRLLYTDDGPNRCGTRVHSIDVLARITSPSIPRCFLEVHVSPDGRHVIAGGGTGYDTGDGIGPIDPAEENRFWIVDSSTGTGPRLDDGPLDRIGWSPDGRWLWHDSFIGPADGSSWTELPKPLTIGSSCAPCWSPDGSYLAIRTDDGLVIGDGSGAGLHLVPTIPSVFSWSHDGRRVAFLRDGDAWVGNIDGRDVQNITNFDGGGAGSVALTSDGEMAAVMRGTKLWLIDRSGARTSVDLGADVSGQAVNVEWAPGGVWLAVIVTSFEATGGAGTTIFLSAHGDQIARVNASHLAWAPDGGRAAVWVSPWDLDPQSTTAKTPKAKGTTYLVGIDGNTVALDDAWSVAWSPDGSTFALRGGTVAASRIDVADADGGQRHTVSTGTISGLGDLTWVR